MSSQEDSQPSQDSTMTLMDENPQEVLYFAYGSNLSTAQMRQRCPHSTPIGLGHLAGWRWIINERGFANVVREATAATAGEDEAAAGEGVYGLLYLLPAADEERLDGHEGVPWAYEKLTLAVRWARDGAGRAVGEDEGAVRALVYVDGTRTGEAAPREEYVARMERGIEDAVANWGMAGAYADRVMRRFWAKK